MKVHKYSEALDFNGHPPGTYVTAPSSPHIIKFSDSWTRIQGPRLSETYDIFTRKTKRVTVFFVFSTFNGTMQQHVFEHHHNDDDYFNLTHMAGATVETEYVEQLIQSLFAGA